MAAKNFLTAELLSDEYDKFPKREKTASDDDITVLDLVAFRCHILDHYDLPENMTYHPLTKFINNDKSDMIYDIFHRVEIMMMVNSKLIISYLEKYEWLISDLENMVLFIKSNFSDWIGAWLTNENNDEQTRYLYLVRRVWIFIYILQMQGSKYLTNFLNLLAQCDMTEYITVCLVVMSATKYVTNMIDCITTDILISRFNMPAEIFQHLIVQADPDVLTDVLKECKPDLAQLLYCSDDNSVNMKIIMGYESCKTSNCTIC